MYRNNALLLAEPNKLLLPFDTFESIFIVVELWLCLVLVVGDEDFRRSRLFIVSLLTSNSCGVWRVETGEDIYLLFLTLCMVINYFRCMDNRF